MRIKTQKKENKWIDVSVAIKTDMVHWPGDPSVSVKRILDIEKGDVCNVSFLSMGTHTGTHVDAPLHYLSDGNPMDKIDFDAFIGPARVIQIKNKKCITPEELSLNKIKKGERLLFKTWNSGHCWGKEEFIKDFVFISREAAGYLAEKKIKSAGVDYLSVGGYYKDGIETHKILLEEGICLIEGLNLNRIKPGNYDMICLPIKIFNSEGAPARVIIRKRK